MNSPEFQRAEPSISYDENQKKLTVRNAEHFPEQVFDFASDVEVLDMSHNKLTSLPDDLARLRKLRVAFFSGNDLQEVPQVLTSCQNLEMVGLKSCNISSFPDGALPKNLRGLILTDNRLTEIPASIGDYGQLQKLMLTGNQLTGLPEEILKCQNLELIRVSTNSFVSSPAWIAELPNLAWYADSGNDFSERQKAGLPPFPTFSWQDVVLGEKIGESAKNVVYAARLADGTPVAVKEFGEGITTDGLPDDDITACLLAGNHPNIIGGLGKLTDPTHGREGLIMPLVPDSYSTLGSPPNLVTLTRDVYPREEKCDPRVAVNIARNIAAAMQHLHARGVMHGDVYAHNVLVSRTGEAKLGDFGAASLYDPEDVSEKWREKMDVRGFGHLVEELSHLAARSTESDDRTMTTLRAVSDQCTSSDVDQTPTFADITRALKTQ